MEAEKERTAAERNRAQAEKERAKNFRIERAAYKLRLVNECKKFKDLNGRSPNVSDIEVVPNVFMVCRTICLFLGEGGRLVGLSCHVCTHTFSR